MQAQDHIFLIETDKIAANPYQPRKVFNDEGIRGLADSIREFGILQPLVVSKVEEDAPTGTQVRYELIAGERRLRAARLLQLERVPAVIKNVRLDRHRLEMAIVENVQRANLNPIESAKAYQRLHEEFDLTQREIASRIGKSRAAIANTMRLLSLPSQALEAVSDGRINESQARLLLSVDDPAAQQAFFEDILKNNLSVRDLKLSIDKHQYQAQKPKGAKTVDPDALNLQKALEEFLGARVKLESSGDSGKITIPYESLDELHTIVEKMIHQRSLAQAKAPEEHYVNELVGLSAPSVQEDQRPEQITHEHLEMSENLPAKEDLPQEDLRRPSEESHASYEGSVDPFSPPEEEAIEEQSSGDFEEEGMYSPDALFAPREGIEEEARDIEKPQEEIKAQPSAYQNPQDDPFQSHGF
ncbi:MAG: ParB/RepB/Spo0J family partition protein [Candidatus Harrisonbacteria bacterium]|nr:ParB/RepB/Spo0J family partition protein [Candidatus Harrisonbacteria bacterium]